MLTLIDADLDRAAKAIASARALLICAGAGMGVDSGLPDFRGDDGFWNAYPPYRHLGVSFTDMADPRWFGDDPAFAWGFYGHRLNLYRETTPHKGFEILRRWGESVPGGYFVFTSNVDGQFQRAGFDPQRVVECHGAIEFSQCMSAHCESQIWPSTDAKIEIDVRTMKAAGPLPICPVCGSVARPNILMFGDWHWDGSRSDEQMFRLRAWLEEHDAGPFAVVECGAGMAIPSVRSFAWSIASRQGTLVRINPREPQVPAKHVGLPTGALDALEQIDVRVRF